MAAIEDHVLILQLERAVEVLKDDVDAVLDDDAYADAAHEHDEYATDYEVRELRKDLREAVDIITGLTEKVAELEQDLENAYTRITALEDA